MQTSKTITTAVLASSLALSGCATAAVGSAVVGTTVAATKVVVKGTVGAGKLVYRGGKAVVKGTANAVSNEDTPPDIADDYRKLPDPEETIPADDS